jgi:asparagine synthase (glutamine-hydrolysing)
MCRIAGIASRRLPLEEMQHTVAAMCSSMRHGGPDDEGVFTSAAHHLVLGHRRLAILDLEASGHQPMHYAAGHYTITYNGELYNYRELRSELKAIGYHFNSCSDTEVIMASFAAWGTAAFNRFNGMFAFGLFDSVTADLYLVRDSLGIKPLYYFKTGDTLAFSSEVRAFSYWPQRIASHPHWPVLLMAYGFLPEPVTTLKNVVPLEKGTYIRYNTVSGDLVTKGFDQYNFMEGDLNRKDALERVREALTSSVKRHLLADAPIGTFLSGGIDSSIVALLADKVKEHNLSTLSLYFKEEAYSEKAYQDVVRQKLASAHHEERLTEDEFHFSLPTIVDKYDLPSCDGINTWFISKLAAKTGLKAVLSGIGGDELFGGYPSFRRVGLTNRLQNFPAVVLQTAIYHRTSKFKRIAYLSIPGIKGQFLFQRGHFTPSFIAKYLEMTEKEVWTIIEESHVFPQLDHLSLGNQASWMELNIYMQNLLLRDADVMSMAHGIELRVPFLEKEFVRLVLSLNSAEKFSGKTGKQLLVDAFNDLLPSEVWQRKKMGFTFPYREWLQEDEWVQSKLMNGGKATAALWNDFKSGQHNWSALLIALHLQKHQHETQPAFSYA